MADDILVTTLGDLAGRGFKKRVRKLTKAGVPGLLVAGPAGMLAQRHLQKKGRGRRLLRRGGAGMLVAGPAGVLALRHLDQRRSADEPASAAEPMTDAVPVAGMGDLGRFKFKKITRRITKPIKKLGKVAQKTIAKNAGVLQAISAIAPAFGPMGMAAGAIIGAGTGLVAAREQKKAERAAEAEARRAEQQQAAANAAAEAEAQAQAQVPMSPQPMPAWPMSEPAPEPMAYQPPPSDWAEQQPMPTDEPAWPSGDSDGGEVIVAGSPPSAPPRVYLPEVMPPEEYEGEMPVMAGLGAAPAAAGLPLVTLAALGLGAWWFMRSPVRGR
jgi:hypothetical protein